MSVMIKGMKMPTSCAKCELFGEYGCPFVGAVGYALTERRRNERCPLVELPPHGRLIDGDAISKQLEQKLNISIGQAHAYYRFVMAWINEAPAIIEAEEQI